MAGIQGAGSLSIHRGDLHPEIDEDGDPQFVNPIDQKLRSLSVDVSRYFSLLDNQAAKLNQEYQKSFFLSLLESRPSGIKALDDSLIDEEKGELTKIFLEFGLTRNEFGPALDDHFVRVKRTNEHLKRSDKDRPKPSDSRGIDIFSIFDTQRIHRLVEKWRELEKHKSEIYQTKNELKSIIDGLFYQKELIYDERNRIFFKNKNIERKIGATGLSSGEKQLFILLVEAMLQEKEPTVYLADEPELSLHIDWQEKIVDSILLLNPNAQIVFATHSPDIVSRYEAGVIKMETL